MTVKIPPVILVICDGLGYAPAGQGNAVQQADMKFFNALMSSYPSAYLDASGEAVGLLSGLIGNSEVGHMTLGAGRVVKSSIVRFHELIQSGQLAQHAAASLLRNFAQTGKTLHVLGLLSDGGVHSHEFHIHGMIELAVHCGVKKIVIHPILDGRDVAPMSAQLYLERLELKLQLLGVGKIGSVQGRFYAMDRDNNIERTHAAYAMLCGIAGGSGSDWRSTLAAAYTNGDSDEFIKPVLFDEADALQEADGVIFVNVRPDRAKQLTTCLLGLSAQEKAINLDFVLTGYRYDQSFKNQVILEPQFVQDTFLDVVEKAQPTRPVFLIAETEKYAHVTYFFKGMRDEHSLQEVRVMVPSLKMHDYVASPQMAAASITASVEKILTENPTVLCVVNYANADMVGHSGNLAATIAACRELDAQLKRVYEIAVGQMGGTLIVTADHGNAEAMLDSKGKARTAHTTNPVPYVMVAQDLKIPEHEPKNLAKTYGIACVASAILKRMGIEAPKDMVTPIF
jgi:2,3-bisphosphoglycerate-independent phosphoglycerate mutase